MLAATAPQTRARRTPEVCVFEPEKVLPPYSRKPLSGSLADCNGNENWQRRPEFILQHAHTVPVVTFPSVQPIQLVRASYHIPCMIETPYPASIGHRCLILSKILELYSKLFLIFRLLSGTVRLILAMLFDPSRCVSIHGSILFDVYTCVP